MLKRQSKLGNEVLLGDEEGEGDEEEEGIEYEQHNGSAEHEVDGDEDDDAIVYGKPASSRTRGSRNPGQGKALGKPTLGGKGNSKGVVGVGSGKPPLLSPEKRSVGDEAEDEQIEDAVEVGVDINANGVDE